MTAPAMTGSGPLWWSVQAAAAGEPWAQPVKGTVSALNESWELFFTLSGHLDPQLPFFNDAAGAVLEPGNREFRG